MHTHYYNDRGVCVCGDDIAYELKYENNEYHSNYQSIVTGKIYYYKFTSHGEGGIDLIIDSETVTFDRVEIRADGMLQTIAGPKDYSKTVYTYKENLVNNKVYFLKITYNGEGLLV